MKQRLLTGLAFLAAVSLTLAPVAPTQVLCVDPDGHVKIEDAFSDCCLTEASAFEMVLQDPGPPDFDDTASERCSSCVDLPLTTGSVSNGGPRTARNCAPPVQTDFIACLTLQASAAAPDTFAAPGPGRAVPCDSFASPVLRC